jgi:hypothetical protein
MQRNPTEQFPNQAGREAGVNARRPRLKVVDRTGVNLFKTSVREVISTKPVCCFVDRSVLVFFVHLGSVTKLTFEGESG